MKIWCIFKSHTAINGANRARGGVASPFGRVAHNIFGETPCQFLLVLLALCGRIVAA